MLSEQQSISNTIDYDEFFCCAVLILIFLIKLVLSLALESQLVSFNQRFNIFSLSLLDVVALFLYFYFFILLADFVADLNRISLTWNFATAIFIWILNDSYKLWVLNFPFEFQSTVEKTLRFNPHIDFHRTLNNNSNIVWFSFIARCKLFIKMPNEEDNLT